jgi:hypothetical protein
LSTLSIFHIFVWVNFWGLCFVLLTYSSVPLPVCPVLMTSYVITLVTGKTV